MKALAVIGLVTALCTPCNAESLTTITTAAGPITVAASLTQNFQAFFNDLVNEVGFRPRRVHCYAGSGHVRHSLHHWGAACDVDQSGWNRTAGPMYSAHVTEIAHRHGLMSGCEFRSRRDCGHIQLAYATRRSYSGGRIARHRGRSSPRRYAGR